MSQSATPAIINYFCHIMMHDDDNVDVDTTDAVFNDNVNANMPLETNIYDTDSTVIAGSNSTFMSIQSNTITTMT